MKCVLAGSRFFGASVLQALHREPGIEFAGVVVPAADDRLALAAHALGVPVHMLANPKLVPGEAVPEGTELIIAAHTHARVSNEALQRARLGGVGYHPSLLPRHRGIAAVEWTVLQGDATAGGSVYHLADAWDKGAIAAQEWCFVLPGEGARELWERALAPMGLRLLAQVVQHARLQGALPSQTQDERFATKAPLLRKAVVLTEDRPAATTALVVTIMGPDRPGIVSQLSSLALRHGANWAASRMSNLAGEFAGMLHLDVPRDNADALAAALRALQGPGLRVQVTQGAGSAAPAGQRGVSLELVGEDRVGIVSTLARLLAERGISIEHIHTEIINPHGSAAAAFKVAAHLLVPAAVSNDALREDLQGLARAMMLDIALGERQP